MNASKQGKRKLIYLKDLIIDFKRRIFCSKTSRQESIKTKQTGSVTKLKQEASFCFEPKGDK